MCVERDGRLSEEEENRRGDYCATATTRGPMVTSSRSKKGNRDEEEREGRHSEGGKR